MATSKLIQWVPEIADATYDDIFRFGPNAAQVRGLINFLQGMSPEAYKATSSANAVARGAAQSRAGDYVADVVENADRYDELDRAKDYAANSASRGGLGGAPDWSGTWVAARNAAGGEVASDLIEPQFYKTLTDPLNAGRVLDLRAPEAGPEFMRLIRQLRPATADDVERIADLSVDPRMQGIVELLQGLKGGMPLAAKINAARRLDSASRQGRRMQ